MSQTACNPKLTSYMRFKDTDVLDIYKQLLADIKTARDAYVSTGEAEIISDYHEETAVIDAKNTASKTRCTEIDARINAHGTAAEKAQAWLDVALRGKTGDVVNDIGTIWPGGDGESKEDSFKKSFLPLSEHAFRVTLGIVASRTTYKFSSPDRGYGYTPLGDVATPNPKKEAKKYKNVLVCLDSNHTHDHVLAELQAYAQLTSVGNYCVVYDTIIEDISKEMLPERPWGLGNNPKTAVREFLKTHHEFEVDKSIEDKLQITASPDGYLKRIR